MKKAREQMQIQFDKMCQTGKLFRSEVSGDKVWEIYLKSFTPEADPVFRDPESSTHNCKLCNNFIRRYGNIVALDANYKIITLFDNFSDVDLKYSHPFEELSFKLRNAKISDVFVETFNELNSLPYEKTNKNMSMFKLGIFTNYKQYTEEEANKFGVVKPDEIRTFEHFGLNIPASFISMSNSSQGHILGIKRDNRNVFQRTLTEIPIDTLELVKDLIKQGSLLNGEAQLEKLEKTIEFKREFDNLSSELRDNWCWVNSDNVYAKFGNELIGVLCRDLAEGVEINKACKDWNYRVDPVNYMKAVAPITQAQVKQAQKFVEENGIEESFIRRVATIDDIKASDILHINSSDTSTPKVSIFDGIASKSTRHKKSQFDNVEEISIEKFMKDVLPNCTSVEAFVENRMKGNFVTMTTSKDKSSKPIFKWDNNYSWTYNGNLAGKSMIKEEVKKAGGVTDAFLRFSLMWNEDGKDIVDLDAHCIEPGGNQIYYGAKVGYFGRLDIDMINPTKVGIENIYFHENKIVKGKYLFRVRNYNGNNHKNFKCEIAIGGNNYSYIYPQKLQHKQFVDVAEVTIDSDLSYTIKHFIEPNSGESVSSKIYNLNTNEFHKVNLMCLSPNFWGSDVGHKHYFFMLEGCKTDKELRSFHNENLKSELLEHRKVFDVLGETTKVTPDDKQLSGLGFNATVKDELIVRCKGSFNRVLKIKF